MRLQIETTKFLMSLQRHSSEFQSLNIGLKHIQFHFKVVRMWKENTSIHGMTF